MTFEEWLEIGKQNKWASDPICDSHDTYPVTKEEVELYDDGERPCIDIIRLYKTPEEFDKAENNK
jgi:hypothetical protein